MGVCYTKHMSDAQHQYFEQAYRTGSDIWSMVPYHNLAMSLLPELPKDALVLDVGTGRGVWLRKLVDHGYRVLGIDYVQQIVDRANRDLKEQKISDRARFMLGNALDIPFTDSSFDAITDIGLLQHLKNNEWFQYAAEVSRVLRPNGYYLNVSLSRQTPRFLGFTPSLSEGGHFEKWGVSYYFFKNSEIVTLFENDFDVIEQKVEFFEAKSDPGDTVAMVFTLMKKRN